MIKYINNYDYNNCFTIKRIKYTFKNNLMYNYVDFILKIISDTCEMLTGLNFLEWLYEVRWYHVWWFNISPICSWVCEGQGICPLTHIGYGHNTWSIQMGLIWVYMTYTYEDLDFVVWVTPRLILVCFNAQDLHATFQFYEEFLMGENPTVCNFCRSIFFSWASGIFKGGLVV